MYNDLLNQQEAQEIEEEIYYCSSCHTRIDPEEIEEVIPRLSPDGVRITGYRHRCKSCCGVALEIAEDLHD